MHSNLFNNHSNISTDGSCSEVTTFDNWDDRCYFVQNNEGCQDVDGFINYIQFIYCTAGTKSLFPFSVTLLILWLLVLFIGLAVSADNYFCPSIETISKTLGLSQNIAGVTLLALGNGAPDIFSSLAGIGQDRPGLVFGELFGAGIFVTACVAGAVSITKPFLLMQRPFLRDVCFYILAAFGAFVIFWKQEMHVYDAVGFLVLYIVYLIVVVVGRYIHQKTRPPIPYLAQVDELNVSEDSEYDNQLARHPTVYTTEDNQTPEIQLVPESEGCTSFRTNFKLLINALNPINVEEWDESNIVMKCYEVVKSPVELLFRLTIPVVDTTKPRDNWSQYLILIQCVLGPIFSVFAVNAAPIAIGGSNFKVWELTFILSLLVATAVGFTSRSSPPVYHKIFAFIGFVISIVWIYMIANELVSVLRAFGVMFGLSDAILGLTVLAWGNSIGDLIADTSMASRGSPRAGFSACFGGPLFNLLLGIGLPFSIQMIRTGQSIIQLVCNKMTLVLSGGLFISLSFSLIIMPIMKFRANKYYGIALIVFYFIFLAVCIIIEFTVMGDGNDSCNF